MSCSESSQTSPNHISPDQTMQYGSYGIFEARFVTLVTSVLVNLHVNITRLDAILLIVVKSDVYYFFYAMKYKCPLKWR